MRLLVLVLNILIGASLATKAPDLAATTLAKTSKNKSHTLHHARSKKKAPANSGDVWARIRLGMKIHSASVVQAGLPQKNTLAELDVLSNPSEDSCSAFNRLQAPEDIKALAKPSLNIRPTIATASNPDSSAFNQMGFSREIPSTTIIKPKSPGSTQFRHVSVLRNKSTTALGKKIIRSRIDIYREIPRRTSLVRLKSQLNSTSLNGKPALSTSTRRTHLDHLETMDTLAKLCAARTDFHKSRQAMINDRIGKHIAAYTKNPGFVYGVAERARPYLYHIVEGLSKNRLPMELALLPIVESAYQPTAQSPKNAAGLWQFIPSTGNDFNLEQSSDYDERLDIVESTQAAIRFISGLKDHFKGDWLLALAAYNSGQATVDNAISRNQAEGLATDFWSLRLPEETQNYVPRLLALSDIFAHPTSYGIKLPYVRNEPYFVKVKIDREFDINYLAEKDIRTVAKLANLTHEQFNHLNPGYLTTILSRNDSYTFLMPVGNAKQFRQRLAGIAKFMAELTSPVKSLALKEKPSTKIDFTKSSLYLGSLLASSEVYNESKCSTAFLSLNVSGFCSKYRIFSAPPDSTAAL